jgi:hypothetical protein
VILAFLIAAVIATLSWPACALLVVVHAIRAGVNRLHYLWSASACRFLAGVELGCYLLVLLLVVLNGFKDLLERATVEQFDEFMLDLGAWIQPVTELRVPIFCGILGALLLLTYLTRSVVFVKGFLHIQEWANRATITLTTLTTFTVLGQIPIAGGIADAHARIVAKTERDLADYRLSIRKSWKSVGGIGAAKSLDDELRSMNDKEKARLADTISAIAKEIDVALSKNNALKSGWSRLDLREPPWLGAQAMGLDPASLKMSVEERVVSNILSTSSSGQLHRTAGMFPPLDHESAMVEKLEQQSAEFSDPPRSIKQWHDQKALARTVSRELDHSKAEERSIEGVADATRDACKALALRTLTGLLPEARGIAEMFASHVIEEYCDAALEAVVKTRGSNSTSATTTAETARKAPGPLKGQLMQQLLLSLALSVKSPESDRIGVLSRSLVGDEIRGQIHRAVIEETQRACERQRELSFESMFSRRSLEITRPLEEMKLERRFEGSRSRGAVEVRPVR